MPDTGRWCLALLSEGEMDNRNFMVYQEIGYG